MTNIRDRMWHSDEDCPEGLIRQELTSYYRDEFGMIKRERVTKIFRIDRDGKRWNSRSSEITPMASHISGPIDHKINSNEYILNLNDDEVFY